MAENELMTERLRLRRPVAADAARIFQRYAQDPEVTKYLIWAPHKSVEDTRAFIAFCDVAWQSGRQFPWIIERLADGELLGCIELRFDGHKADLGYVFARDSWGKGYATEAVRAVIARAFAEPGIYRVWAVCDVGNVGSARVLEKAGMTREGTLKRWASHGNVSREPRDAYCYAVVR